MTTSSILSLMGYHLDDPNGVRYTSTIKLLALDEALEYIAGAAKSKLLPSLQYNIDLTVPATGVSLPSDYMRYMSSYLYLLDRWVSKVEVDDLDILDNQYSKGTDIDPACYLWNTTYYLRVGTYSGNFNKVRLYYIKKPTALTSSSVIPIDERLHRVLIDIAESKLKLTYNFGEPEEAMKQYDTAIQLLEEINKKASEE